MLLKNLIVEFENVNVKLLKLLQMLNQVLMSLNQAAIH